MGTATTLVPLNLSREAFRRWYLMLIGSGLLLIALLVLNEGRNPVNRLLGWIIYLLLYVIYGLHPVTDRSPRRTMTGLPLALLAAYLTFGPVLALLLIIAGSLLSATLQFLLETPYERAHYWRVVQRAVLKEIAVLSIGLLGGVACYRWLGGRTPVQNLDPGDLINLGALILITLGLRDVLLYLINRGNVGIESRTDLFYKSLYRITFDTLLTVPGVLTGLAFYRSDMATLAITLSLLVLAALALRIVAVSRAALDRQLDELVMLNSVSKALAAISGTDDLFDVIYEQIIHLLNAPLFYIALTTPEHDYLTFPLVVHYGQRRAWQPQEWDNGPVETIVNRRGALYCAKGRGPVFETDAKTGYGSAACASYVGVPIADKESIYGVLAIQHPARTNAFSAADQRLLETVAAQTATALRNARLYDQAQQFSDGLVSVNHVSSIINASLELTVILQQICTVAQTLSHASSAVIFLKAQDRHFEPVYTTTLPGATVNALARTTVENDTLWSVLLSRPESTAIHDLATDRRTTWLAPLFQDVGIQAVTITPFISMRSLINERTLSPTRDLIGFQLIGFDSPHSPDDNIRHLLQMLANQAAVAIENAALFEETQNTVRRLAYLAEATRIFTDNLDLNRTAQTIVDWIVDALELSSATLALWNRSENVLVLQAHAISQHISMEVPVPYLEQPLHNLPEVERALQGRWSQMISADEDTLSPGIVAIFEATGLQTMLFTPLVVREDAIGLLALGKLSRELIPSGDVDLAEAIASQAATALQNAQFYALTETQLSDRVNEILVLERVLRRISARVNAQDIISDVLQAAASATRADILVCALTRSEDRMEISWCFSTDVERINRRVYDDIHRGVIGQVIRTGEPLLIEDTSQITQYWRPEGTAGYAAELCVPIVHEEQVVGVLNLESTQPGVFTESDLRFLQSLAGHTAIALNRAHLFARSKRQIEILDAIRVVSLQLLDSETADDVLDQICRVGLSLVHAINIHLYYYNPETDHLSFARSLWADGRHNVEVAAPRRNGLTYQAIHTDQPVISDRFTRVSGIPTRMLGVFPLKHQGKILGTLNAAVDDPSLLGEDEIRALELLANQAASAIARVRLFEDRQRQLVIMEDLRNNSLTLLTTTDVKEVTQIVCASALFMAHAEDTHLYLYDTERDNLTFSGSYWRDGTHDVEFAPPRPNGVTATAARSGEPVLHRGTELLDIWADENENGAILGMPLKHGTRVVGVLNVAVRNAKDLDPDTINALELLANQSATALVNVQLYEEIRDGRDQFQVIMDTAREGLVLVDQHGILLRSNPAAEELLGLNLAPYRGRHLLYILHQHDWPEDSHDDFRHPDNIKAQWRQLSADPHEITYRQVTLEKAGGIIYLEEESAPVLSENGTPIARLFVWRDVTATRQLADARNELVHTIVHDLRSPLTSIKGGLNLLEMMFLDDSPVDELEEIRALSESGTEKMLALIGSLLDLAQNESGTFQLELSPTHFARPLQEAVQSLKILFTTGGVTLEQHCPDDLPPLLIDAEKVRRILINILDNALKYTPRGGTIRLSIDPPQDGDWLQVRIEDGGPGIPPELRDRVFERYATGTVKGASRRGTGLGMPFCKMAIEAHGGRIWIEDGLDGGAVFCFTLPVAH